MTDRVRILVQTKHVGPGLQNRFRVTSAATGAIDDQGPGARGQELDHLADQHGTVVRVVLHFVRLLLHNQGTGCEPNRPFKEQCIHSSLG